MGQAERLAERFHTLYELIARTSGYATREERVVLWDALPEQKRQVMIAVWTEILKEGVYLPHLGPNQSYICMTDMGWGEPEIFLDEE